MTRDETLAAARRIVSEDRQATHGGPEQSFATIADLWTAYLDHAIGPADVAAMMALLKIARLKANPKHADSWIDLAGYAACGAEVATCAN